MSFGSSRPVIAAALQRPELKDRCEKWMGISAPEAAGPAMRFLLTPRLHSVFSSEATKSLRHPDLQLCGTHDIYAYPTTLFGEGPKEWVEPVGHYSLMTHPLVVQRTLDEMGSDAAY
jgi:hypothetical protein